MTALERPVVLNWMRTLIGALALLAMSCGVALGHERLERIEYAAKMNDSWVRYEFGSRRLNPGEALEVEVPSMLRSQPVEFVLLSHRQDRAFDRSGVRSHKDYDSTPAYSSVQVFDDSFGPDEAWRYWLGPASSDLGAKFAEVRSRESPEVEGLYSWRKYGHGAVAFPWRRSLEPVRASRLRVVSTGVDPVFLHGLVLKVAPRVPSRLLEKVFSPGTRFGDYVTGEGTRYGGGERFGGMYPDAIELRRYGEWHADLGDGFVANGREIRIKLPPDVAITSIDVAAGDARGLDEDGEYRRGGGKLTIEWVRGGRVLQTLMRAENTGPQGIYRGMPERRDERTSSGDEIVLRTEGGTISVMGVRAGFSE